MSIPLNYETLLGHRKAGEEATEALGYNEAPYIVFFTAKVPSMCVPNIQDERMKVFNKPNFASW